MITDSNSVNDPKTRARTLSELFKAAPRVDQTSREKVLSWANKLQELGLHLFPIKVGEKIPAGRWSKIATTNPDELAKHYDQGMNLGVHLGKSGLVVIDADTTQEVDALSTYWDSYCLGELPPKTVQTPGTSTGHSEGGHWYFVAEPAHTTSAKQTNLEADGHTAQAVVKTGQTLTVLPGGWRVDVADNNQPNYITTGQVNPHLPSAIDEAITAPPKEKKEHTTPTPSNDQVEQWKQDTSWADILEPHGWVSYETDSCGCDTYTRPAGVAGVASNGKSATAHVMCQAGGGDLFHVWSDNAEPLEGGKSYDKLDLYAALNCEGSRAKAFAELGLERTTGTPLDTSTLPATATDDPNPFERPTGHVDTLTKAVDSGDDSELWNATPQLQEVKKWAWAKMVDPYGVLLVTLSEVALHIPPHVIMEDPRDASLNLITLLMSPSGGGKGNTAELGRKLVAPPRFDHALTQIEERTGFSGQGLGKCFAPPELDDDERWTAPRVRFVESEVKNLINLSSGTTSTQIPTLNKFFMGEPLGATNSGKDNSWHVEPHTYRGVLRIEAQNDVVAPLLTGDNKNTGFTARLVVAHPRLPLEGRKEWGRQLDQGQLDLNMENPTPVFEVDHGYTELTRRDDGLAPFPTSQEVLLELKRARMDIHKSDAITAHEGLRRRKIATLLAVAHNEWEVTPYWWNLAKYVMDNHRAVLHSWERKQRKQTQDAKVKTIAANLAAKQQAEEETLFRRVDQVAKWVCNNVDRHGCKWSDVYRYGPAKRWGKEVKEAVREALESDTRVELKPGSRGGWTIAPSQ